MRKHSTMFMVGGIFLISLVLLFTYSCNKENEIITQAGSTPLEKLQAIKTVLPQNYNGDGPSMHQNFHKGEVKGDVTLDFTALLGWPILEVYSFKAESHGNNVEGYFEATDYWIPTGDIIGQFAGRVTCVTFEEDCRTARLGGEVEYALGEPELPPNHYAFWTVRDNKKDAVDQATDLRAGQWPDWRDYHCEVGFSIEWFETFMEIASGEIKVEAQKCKDEDD